MGEDRLDDDVCGRLRGVKQWGNDEALIRSRGVAFCAISSRGNAQPVIDVEGGVKGAGRDIRVEVKYSFDKAISYDR